eukprot:scaffold2785_cov85-Isochrysis_galbana.AAC.1
MTVTPNQYTCDGIRMPAATCHLHVAGVGKPHGSGASGASMGAWKQLHAYESTTVGSSGPPNAG